MPETQAGAGSRRVLVVEDHIDVAESLAMLLELVGYEVAKRLRSMPELQDVKLIALTGYGQTEDRQRTQAAGFDDHLVKPVELETLQSALGRV